MDPCERNAAPSVPSVASCSSHPILGALLRGAPLFKVFPQFGELLLGSSEPCWLVETLGWTYHFSNGAALGIMFLAALARPTPNRLLAGAIVWALLVELLLFLTPDKAFLGVPFDARFVALTLSAHLVFGVVLGLWLRARAAVSRSRTRVRNGGLATERLGLAAR